MMQSTPQFQPQTTPPQSVDQKDLLNCRPTSPVFWYKNRAGLLSLPICDFQLDAEFHVSTAVVKITGVWQNTSNDTVDLLFACPLKGTVTNCHILVNNSRLFCTSVIEKSEIKGLNPVPVASTIPQIGTDEAFVPDLFKMPITQVRPGDTIRVTLDFIEPLDYHNHAYNFNFPLQFGPNILPQGVPLDTCCRINLTVNTVVPGIKVQSFSHALAITENEQAARLECKVCHGTNTYSTNLNLSYSIESAQVIAACVKEPKFIDQNGDEHGNFILMATPPTMTNVQGYGRDVVFLLDRSGSMVGDPFEQACQGLQHAFAMLTQYDRFTVIGFDHTVTQWSQQLIPASQQACSDALGWVRANPPNMGATDIGTPVGRALQILTSMGNPASIPIVFLLTDGAVKHERNICNYVVSNVRNVRILTFGIGSYCNWFFLKMLAEIGRGFFDACVYQELLATKVQNLFAKCAVPVLTNITLHLVVKSGQCELYPSPIPDLFMGTPLVIAAKYTANGQFPQQIKLVGDTPEGKMEIPIFVTQNSRLPVESVFLKQRLDLLTSRAWLIDSQDIKNEIIQLSVQHSMPCAYTDLVAYETTPEKHAEQQQKEEKEKKDQKTQTSKGLSKGAVAAIAVGGVVALGAAAYFGGDIVSTLSNTAAIGAVGDGIGGLFSAISSCSCCGAACDSLDSCGTMCGGLCAFCGDIFESCGSFNDICGALCGCMNDCIGGLGSLGDVCGGCGECLGNLICTIGDRIVDTFC